MILARCKLPKVKIPKSVRFDSRQRDIETRSDLVPFGADIWIACRFAWPHVDHDYTDALLFLTLSVESDHVAGDAQLDGVNAAVPAGTLFVIDPTVAHWLAPQEAWCRRDSPGWIGVQWEVPRLDAPATAREIVDAMAGVWDIRDDRYRGWNIDNAGRP